MGIKLKSYAQLKKEFDLKLKQLQKVCPHNKTQWYREAWAIGHFSGFNARVCLVCGKVLERKKEESGKGVT